MNVDRLRSGDPDRLGAYWLAGRLGSGGQGVVYEAYDEASNRVAVKVLHAYLAGDPQLRRRFLREVRAAQRAASFCTAAVLGHDLEGERPYIVSEFVPGPSMRQAITSPLTGDTLPPPPMTCCSPCWAAPRWPREPGQPRRCARLASSPVSPRSAPWPSGSTPRCRRRGARWPGRCCCGWSTARR